MARGGSKPGERRGGRHKGTPNKITTMTREGLWRYIKARQQAGHRANPFYVLVDLLDSEDARLVVQCAEILVDRLLPRLKATEIAGTVEHQHTRTPLDQLLARLEREEEEARKTLPPWTPPPPLDMGQDAQGVWTDAGDGEDEEGEDSPPGRL